MKSITVYFDNGNKVSFDKDKAIFKDGDTHFTLHEVGDLAFEYSDLVANGRVLVNFAHVCFIRQDPPNEYDDD